MRKAPATFVLAFVAHALGHGYVWRIDADNIGQVAVIPYQVIIR